MAEDLLAIKLSHQAAGVLSQEVEASDLRHSRGWLPSHGGRLRNKLMY